MSKPEQLPLFNESSDDQPLSDDSSAASPRLDAETPIEQAIEVYLTALHEGGASHHTVKAFKSDINLLARWLSPLTPVGSISTGELNQFLLWMSTERDRPCSPKTYARRVTALKNFFGYLHEEEVIADDPSVAVIQKTVSSPLPDVLYQGESDRVLAVTQALRHDKNNPDARPHLLVLLLLETGIKKGEAAGLRQRDVNRDGHYIWIRYQDPEMRYKERKITVSTELVDVLDEYLWQRNPAEGLVFDCTPRNLEYVLRDVADRSGVTLSFELLRWTCAIRDYMEGMDQEEQRQKLGLSRVSWRQTLDRLAEIAARMEV